MFGFLSRNKKQYSQDVSATVPLTYNLEQALYPESNYLNFAKEGYGKNEIVHACIRELSSSISNPRYMLEVPTSEGGFSELESGDLYELMQYPTPSQDWASWLEELVTYLMVSGNVYILKERAKTRKLTALPLLRPDRMTINGGTHGAESYTYEIGESEYTIPAEDVCHLALPNPSGDLYGLAPLQVLARTVNLDLNMTDYAKVFFQNAGVPSGLLKVKRRLQSQEEASVIRNRWRSQFGGKNNFHRVAIMDDDAEYQPMASTMKDLALNELHNFTEARICAVFGVPPILIGANVGLERATYSNYREARFSFNAETVQPLVNKIVRFLNYGIAKEYSNQGKFSVDKGTLLDMIDDKESNSQRAMALFDKGLLTLNEARELVGVEAMDGGDVRRVPANMTELAEGEVLERDASPLPFQPTAPSVEVVEPEVVEPEKDLFPPKVLSPTKQSLASTVHEEQKSDLLRGAVKLRRNLLLDREELEDDMEVDVNRYLLRVKNRIDGILGRLMERSASLDELKQLPFNADGLVSPIEESNLANILYKHYRRITKQTWEHINDAGIAGQLDWSEKLPAVSGLLTQAPARAKLIHSTTSKRVKDIISLSEQRGYSIEQIVRGVPKDKFRGMQSTLAETKTRARLIARTETMRTQNLSTLGYYKAQEFEYVQATDPDGDAGDTYVDPGDPYGRTCIERDGQVYTVEQANNINDHPNGTLSWSPMPRDFVPEEANIQNPSQDVLPPAPPKREPEFDVNKWQPEVSIENSVVKSIGQDAANNRSAETISVISQVARSLKPNLAKKLKTRYDDVAHRPTIKLDIPPSGKVKKPSGVYWYSRNLKNLEYFDHIHIKAGMENWAMAHEMGHQIMHPQRLIDWLGEAQAKAFTKAMKSQFRGKHASQRNLIKKVWVKSHVDSKGVEYGWYKEIYKGKAVSRYSRNNYHEFVAENFKYMITDPKTMKKEFPEIYDIFRKYLLKPQTAEWKSLRVNGVPASGQRTSPVFNTVGEVVDIGQ